MKSRLPAIAGIFVGATLVGGWSLSIAAGTTAGKWRNDPRPPFNATAMCRDGTWSWSRHPDRPSACSNRGGVVQITTAGEAAVAAFRAKYAGSPL